MTVVLVVTVEREPLILKVYVCLVWVPGFTMLKMVSILTRCQFFWFWRWCVYLIVQLAIHVMDRAPEETINRKSPSKHARTGSPNNRRYGHPKGTLPVRAAHGERCGPRTAPTPCPVQRPHRIVARMGPVPSCPCRVPYRFALMLPLRYRACKCLPVFDTYQPYLPMSFLSVFDTYQPYLPMSFLSVFDTYQPYLPMSFLQYTWSIAACLMPVPRSSVRAESVWRAIHFQDVL